MDSNSNIPVGMDVGTTFSAASMISNGKIEAPISINDNGIGGAIYPSVFRWMPIDQIVIGEQALNGMIKDPEHTIFDTKRCIGLKLITNFNYVLIFLCFFNNAMHTDIVI